MTEVYASMGLLDAATRSFDLTLGIVRACPESSPRRTASPAIDWVPNDGPGDGRRLMNSVRHGWESSMRLSSHRKERAVTTSLNSHNVTSDSDFMDVVITTLLRAYAIRRPSKNVINKIFGLSLQRVLTGRRSRTEFEGEFPDGPLKKVRLLGFPETTTLFVYPAVTDSA